MFGLALYCAIHSGCAGNREIIVIAPPPAPEPIGALPSKRQRAWHDLEMYAFIHFGVNTFTGQEWGHGDETAAVFNPTELDCRQWCEVFRDAGFTGIIITAKHHDGFLLWPSAVSEHDVSESPWKDGRGDVLRELSEACREYGLKFGVYLSPWDRNHPAYGVDDAAYNEYFKAQLREVLTDYGPVFEVWWDGANGDRNDPAKFQEYDWRGFLEVVRELQPEAVTFGAGYSDVRWVGNERGYAGETQWATFESARRDPNRDAPIHFLNEGMEGGDQWWPAETDVSIRPGWFYRASEDDRVKSIEQLLDIYDESVGHNTNLLLNVPPDTRGLIHERDAEVLRAFGKIIRDTFETNLLRGARATASNVRGEHAMYSAANTIDGDDATSWATDDEVRSATITFEMDEAVWCNRLDLREPIELGQRVRAFSVEARVNGAWQPIGRGTTIGHRRIVRFDTVRASAIRVTIEDSRACPLLAEVGLYCAPPVVSIEAPGDAFLESTMVMLTSDLPSASIRYTVDGREPTAESPRYAGPFTLRSSAIVKARAFRDGEPSPLIAERSFMGYQRKDLRPPIVFIREPDPGLRYRVFEGGWQTLDQFDEQRTPVKEGITSNISIEPRSREEHVAIEFDGVISVPEDGLYTFYLTSDDGSRLWFGDDPLIDHDGLHGMETKHGTIGLQAGYHFVKVRWFNAAGGKGLRLEWEGPSIPRAVVPADAWAH